ncbi:MAG: hypothetical protein QG553_900 [Patescibacteria group bacterium]|nr:hypothetical protein [Patescibacteria group bacterium]
MHKDDTAPVAPATKKEPVDVLGLVSIGLAMFGLSLPGFIVGLVGASQAKKAGNSAVISRIGWIMNLVICIIVTILFGLLIAFWPTIMREARNDERRRDLQVLQVRLENYHRQYGFYPNELSELRGIYPKTDPKGAVYEYTVGPEGCIECDEYTLQANLEEDGTYTLESRYSTKNTELF